MNSVINIGSQKSIEDAVYLNVNTSVDLSKLRTSEGCIFYSKLSDTVTALEELVLGWCQQIEQVTIYYTNELCSTSACYIVRIGTCRRQSNPKGS